MTAADRSFHFKRALLRALADAGGYPVLEIALTEAATIKVDWLRPTLTELGELLRAIEADGLATALPSERGRKYSLTDAGRHWLAQNP